MTKDSEVEPELSRQRSQWQGQGRDQGLEDGDRTPQHQVQSPPGLAAEGKEEAKGRVWGLQSPSKMGGQQEMAQLSSGWAIYGTRKDLTLS